MHSSEPVDSDEVYALLGRVVEQALQPSEEPPLQEVIGALYHADLRSGDAETMAACERAIRLLASKMN
ncbi:hypothetical protein [Candidatus Pantoea persica]|uniref:hypothetical protein n=1 Tax=Candidatus Pantoea persica TaxID=2518128 RepID=UPI00215DB82E|nr:hypothetical protein [Candidatus Pantoea persica]MBA2814576.1 hypothetical protein [Candidatus Pantoea persica]